MAPPERIRGTADIPMLPEGVRDIKQIAQLLSKIGGLDFVFHSGLSRMRKIAQILSDATGALTIDMGDKLLGRNWGDLQGRLASEVGDLQTYYTNRPSERPPGGESLDEYRKRYLPTFWDIYQQSRTKRIAVTSHGSTVALVYAWIVAGAQSTWEVCIPAMRYALPPGEVAFIDGSDLYGDLVLRRVNNQSRGPMPFGCSLVRHGKTAWNASSGE